jgi:hypothetical protein
MLLPSEETLQIGKFQAASKLNAIINCVSDEADAWKL